MADGIIDLKRQFTTGLRFNFPRVSEQEKWRRWYYGDYQGLLPNTPNVSNGYSLFSANDLIKIPIIKMASQAFAQEVLADDPKYTIDEANQAWWDASGRSLFHRALLRSIDDWSWGSMGILYTQEDGSVLNADPTTYFRKGEYFDDDEVVGHALATPYYWSEDMFLRPNETLRRPPNYIKIILYEPNAVDENGNPAPINEVAHFRYSRYIIGEQVTEWEYAGITSLITFGEMDSWYPDVADLLAAYMIRLTNHHRTMNLNDNSGLLVPQSVIPPTAGPGDTTTSAQRIAALLDTPNPVLTYSQTDGSSHIGSINRNYQFGESREFLTTLGRFCYMATGLPPSIYGVDIGLGESGAARDMTRDRAAARIRNLRNQLTYRLPAVVKGMRSSVSKFSIAFIAAPFTNRDAEQKVLFAEAQANLIDRNEYRRLRGYDPMPANEDTAEPEVPVAE